MGDIRKRAGENGNTNHLNEMFGEVDTEETSQDTEERRMEIRRDR